MTNKERYIKSFSHIEPPEEITERILNMAFEKKKHYFKSNGAHKDEMNRKEIPVKYFAVASAVAFLAVGTYILKRGAKQDINIM